MTLIQICAIVAFLITVSRCTVKLSDLNKVDFERVSVIKQVGGLLYPQATSTRDVRSLDGVWNFRLSPVDAEYGFKHQWHKRDLDKTGPVIPMPVPSSYNDVGEDITIRDHVGLVWYDRRFHVPSWWLDNKQRIWLRLSSAHYSTQVFINGEPVVAHEIGHLPFEAEITDVVTANRSNLLTVVLDNRLFPDTVPQGNITEKTLRDGTMRQSQSYTFDFFNYAGIHRSVFLYTTPQVYINDVSVDTKVQGTTGIIHFNLTYLSDSDEGVECLVELFDKNETCVATANDCSSVLEVENANLWWPYLMHDDPAYLYTLKTTLRKGNEVLDNYSTKVGIRTVTWNEKAVYLNDKPVYFRGFGMHEDSDLRGKGWDPVLWTKNFNLLKWVGANAFRTSHYPYAEEIYQMADEQGFMIVDECPSVNTDIFTDELMSQHKQSLTELIHRDRNHPSVIMWSIANEPRTWKQEAEPYFAQIVRHVKSLDLSRPVTIAQEALPEEEKVSQHLDVLSFNRYYGWYSESGDLRDVTQNVYTEASTWNRIYKKPVIVMEYGADTISGLHSYPEFMWSEEFQVAQMSEYFKAFDQLRKTGFFIGEFVWNLADFKTAQEIRRAGGNRKGIFDRSRQPKAAAHHLRARYHALAAIEKGIPPPGPDYYVSDNRPAHQEL